jgi:hypothetical protein
MPINISEVKTRSGIAVLRAEFIKEVTVPEAEDFIAKAGITSKYANWPFLITGNITSVSPDVKNVLTPKEKPKDPAPIAVVLNSAVARMVAGMMMRLSGQTNSEYFKNDADALAWLDTAAAAHRKNAG